MSKPFLWRKSVWDCAEFITLAIASVLGITAASITAVPWKTCLAGTGGGFGVFGLFAKFVSKRLEEEAKQEKEAAEALTRRAQEQEIATIQSRASDQARRMVLGIIEAFREKFFESVKKGEQYKNRVTLFVCREADKTTGVGKHLAIYARAGPHPESTRTWALDDNDPKGCRGLAGQVFFHTETRALVAECEWDPNDAAAQHRYATSLGMTVAEAQALNFKSRAFIGVLVMVNGRKWGVLLLDCNQEENLRQRSTMHTWNLSATVAAIGKALSNAESGQ